MATRQDLLELTPAALTALANAGFVKRAQRDVEAGRLPHLQQEADGTVVAHFNEEGVTTRLPPGRTLRDAACTCPASSMCRHRVMLVLAYQHQQLSKALPGAVPGRNEELGREPDTVREETDPAEHSPWTPAHFDDAALIASLSPRTLEQAATLAATGLVIALEPWRGENAPPIARLPMCSVRFFSRSSLAHARCDCQQGGACVHVALAVWAFRQAGDLPPDAPECMVALTPPSAGRADTPQHLTSDAAHAARAQLDALLLALWLDGSAQPLMALTARVHALRGQLQALGWNWVDDALDELWCLLQAQHARSSRFDPQRLLAVSAELWARLHASAHAEATTDTAAPPLHASQILGIGVKGEVALDHLRLVSLGAVLWSDDRAEGADILLADPDTQTVTVIERHWPRAADATTTTLPSRRIAGVALHQIASGQIITKAATRRANGRIEVKAGTRQTSILPLSPAAWDDLHPPLRQPTVAALIAHLHQRLPDFVLPRQAASSAATGAAGALHILSAASLDVDEVYWDAAAQTLHARLLTDAPGDPPLSLELPHRTAAPGAVDALARALNGQWGPLRAISGAVHLQNGHAHMQPLALVTEQRALVLQTQAPVPQPLALLPAIIPRPARQALIHDTQALLAQWLRQGLRHQGGSMTTRAHAQASALQHAGLVHCARLLQTVPSILRRPDRSPLLPQLSTLSLLLDGVGR